MNKKTNTINLWDIAGFRRNLILVIASVQPAFVALGVLLYLGDYDSLEVATIMLVVGTPWVLFMVTYYYSAIRPWQTVANILLSFREQDFSIKAAVKKSDDVVNIVLTELNAISDFLSSSRNSVVESQKLLGRILAEVDVAVFLFDNNQKLVLSNRYAAALYNKKPMTLNGCSVEQLGMTFAKMAAHTSFHEFAFPNRKSRWLVKHSSYRQQGLPFQLIMLADIGQSLRQEELDAWQKLTRILSHEINNALTPLKTTVGSMTRMIDKTETYPDWKNDFKEGLGIIDNRINNLNRLVVSYSQLARQPEPIKQRFPLLPLLAHLAQVYGKDNVVLISHNNVDLSADESQIEQVLVNLIKNAIEANVNALSIEIELLVKESRVEIILSDSGLGIKNIDNVFVPYFTTKPSGSGIGLVVSRQIIEAHGGSLELSNHHDKTGCRAAINLPL